MDMPQQCINGFEADFVLAIATHNGFSEKCPKDTKKINKQDIRELNKIKRNVRELTKNKINLLLIFSYCTVATIY